MGYIQIPKLISGGSDEPVINARSIPQEWQYYTSLKESEKDQAYLFYQGGSDLFEIHANSGNIAITLYGGADGKQPLLKWNTTTKKYQHYENGGWINNEIQPSSTSDIFYLAYADLDNYPSVKGLHLSDLQGKQVTNDENIGTSQLITAIVHNSAGDYASSYLASKPMAIGGTTTTSSGEIPLVAYSGATHGLKFSAGTSTPHFEFVEFTHYNGFYSGTLADSNYLKKVIIPEFSGMTSVNNNFLSDDPNLEQAELPDSITVLGASCFANDYNLKKVKLSPNLESIPSNTFNNCYNLKKFDIPSTVSEILTSAFANCVKLKKLTIPNGVTDLLTSVLDGCCTLENIDIPNTIVTIGTYAFRNCRSLKNIELKEGLQAIGNNAFQNCTGLKGINLPNSLLTIGTHAFNGCEGIKEIIIPQNIDTIDQQTFRNCTCLEKVVLPEGLITIGNYALAACPALKDINLPTTLTTLGTYAFQLCKGLEHLEIPASVTSIGIQAFASCGSMLYIKMKGTPPTLSNANAFASGNTYVKILVPYEYIPNYKSATNWSSATNNIKTKQRGYGTFTQGETLPTTSGSYTLTWFENLNDVISTIHNAVPTVTPITEAPYDGEFYCTIV